MNKPTDKVTELTSQEFEALKVRVVQKFGKYIFNNTNFKINDAWEHILLEMESYIIGQHHLQKYAVHVKIPKNCWENFKLKHMPYWYNRRFPVKEDTITRVITFDHKMLFPKASVDAPTILGKFFIHSHTNDPGVNLK